MKVGIVSTAYLLRYGTKEGAKKMKLHGYDALDFQGFINTETDFFKLEETAFENALKNTGNAFLGVCSIDNIKELAKDFSPLCVGLSGSGPSVYAIFDCQKSAKEFADHLSQNNLTPYLAEISSFGVKETE